MSLFEEQFDKYYEAVWSHQDGEDEERKAVVRRVFFSGAVEFATLSDQLMVETDSLEKGAQQYVMLRQELHQFLVGMTEQEVPQNPNKGELS